jgi:hypothetical protein
MAHSGASGVYFQGDAIRKDVRFGLNTKDAGSRPPGISSVHLYFQDYGFLVPTICREPETRKRYGLTRMEGRHAGSPGTPLSVMARMRLQEESAF